MHRAKSEVIRAYLIANFGRARSIKSESYLYQCIAADYIYTEQQTCVCPTCWKCYNLFAELKKEPYSIAATDLERVAGSFSLLAVTRPEVLQPAVGSLAHKVVGCNVLVGYDQQGEGLVRALVHLPVISVIT
jgi:hypothetical protein